MFGIINFGAFLISGILLNITPGTDTMYILGRSVSNGRVAGYLSALGIGTGSVIHTLFAAFGLSIILAESELAFGIVKYIGAVYLVFLGIKTFLKRKTDPAVKKETTSKNNFRIYVSGALTNVFNPKVALFYLAFLPQFIDSNYSNSFITFSILGLTFTITGTLWGLALATFSNRLSQRIINNSGIKMWLDRITGGVFVLLGIKLALSKLK